MIMTYGCSFTAGEELSDPESDAWPQQLADRFNTTVCNRARPGASNTDIIHQYVSDLTNHKISESDLVIIATTLPGRYGYYQPDCQHMPTLYWMDDSPDWNPDFVYELSKLWGGATEVIKYYQDLSCVTKLASDRSQTYWQTSARSALRNALFMCNISECDIPECYPELLSNLDTQKYIPVIWDEHCNFFQGRDKNLNPQDRQPDLSDVHSGYHPRAHKHREHAELIYEYLNNHTHTS